MSSRPMETIAPPELAYITNDGPAEPARRRALELVGRRLADCLDLQSVIRHARSDPKASSSIGFRRELNEIETDLREYADLLAGRVEQLGWAEDESVKRMAMRSAAGGRPPGFPAAEHGASLQQVIVEFAGRMRRGIEELERTGDAESAGILAEISRVAGTWLWAWK